MHIRPTHKPFLLAAARFFCEPRPKSTRTAKGNILLRIHAPSKSARPSMIDCTSGVGLHLGHCQFTNILYKQNTVYFLEAEYLLRCVSERLSCLMPIP